MEYQQLFVSVVFLEAPTSASVSLAGRWWQLVTIIYSMCGFYWLEPEHFKTLKAVVVRRK